jgi:hypothetical protein
MLSGALGEGAASDPPSSEAALPHLGEPMPLCFEHYELLRAEDGHPLELGRGAMGVTYKAFDVDLRCPVTLKVIS